MSKFNYIIIVLFNILIFFNDSIIASILDTTKTTTSQEKYITAKYFPTAIQFNVTGVSEPKDKNALATVRGQIDYLVNPETNKAEPPLIKKLPVEKHPDRIYDPSFKWYFKPTKSGIYNVKLVGSDKTRRDKGGEGETDIIIEVKNPYFINKEYPPMEQVYENEYLKFDFFVNGLENRDDYLIIRTWKDKIDTIKGTILEMSKENGDFIDKGDAGQVLKLEVLYQGSIFYYLDADSASLENPEEVQNVESLQPKPSIFNIQVVKQVPQVIIPKIDVPYGERIEFTAYYKGLEKSDYVQLNEIERPRVINLKNNQNIYQKHEQLSPGKFAIYVKPGLTIPKDGLPIKVIVKVRGQGKEFNQSIKLVKKKK